MTITAHRYLIVLALIAVFVLPVSAQEVKRPPLTVPATADAVREFSPPGWRIDEGGIIEADLNSDDRPDAALVISHGGTGETDDGAIVKHVLVLALRDSDGKLHRSIVSDSAVLDGDEGGAFGDPFDSLSIDKGTVVISHYGGSRDRWGFTHRYRFQNGHWTLIGLDMGNTDTLDLEHYDNQDINLLTGLVEASEKGNFEGEPKKPGISGSYYELQVLPVDSAPNVDGTISSAEWPGYTVKLNQKTQVFRNRLRWRGADDLSAELYGIRVGDDLFLCARVVDNQVTGGDSVRLVTKRGLVIKSAQSKRSAAERGYVFEARYSLKTIATALRPQDKYVLENLAMVLDSNEGYGDFQGFAMGASVEIVDIDRGGARGIISTRIAGSPYPGSIRIFRKGTLELLSDVEK